MNSGSVGDYSGDARCAALPFVCASSVALPPAHTARQAAVVLPVVVVPPVARPVAAARLLQGRRRPYRLTLRRSPAGRRACRLLLGLVAIHRLEAMLMRIRRPSDCRINHRRHPRRRPLLEPKKQSRDRVAGPSQEARALQLAAPERTHSKREFATVCAFGIRARI